jgi:ornithine decarboxylase
MAAAGGSLALPEALNGPCCVPLRPGAEAVARETARVAHGPLILISRSGALRALAQLRGALPGVSVHYAVKACTERALLAALAEAGCGFELASAGELPALAGLDTPPESWLCGNPVRAAAQTAALHAAGVRLFAVDSVEEVARTARAAPGARLLLRVAVPRADPGRGSGADAVPVGPSAGGSDAMAEPAWWPMRDTFGLVPGDVAAIVAAASAHRLDVAGACFHVGSQCTETAAWVRGVRAATAALQVARAAGHSAQVLSLGGGFPVVLEGSCGPVTGTADHGHASDPAGSAGGKAPAMEVPTVEAIGAALVPALADLPPGVQVLAEPGRYIVASAGVLLTRVTATRSHRGTRWLQLDCGVHNGLIESARGVPYRIRPLRGSGARVAWRISGPSCDGADVLPGEWWLPVGATDGDWFAIDGAAAYAQSRASAFNGLPLPVTRVVD